MSKPTEVWGPRAGITLLSMLYFGLFVCLLNLDFGEAVQLMSRIRLFAPPPGDYNYGGRNYYNYRNPRILEIDRILEIPEF